MDLTTNPTVVAVLDSYPKPARQKLMHLRKLILETASEIPSLDSLEETLKWGEPSYLTKHGSTVRMEWKKSKPDQYAMYFKCTSKLVSTFKIIYSNTFTFEGNRAIVFNLDDEVPLSELKHCVSLALTYHKVKHLPRLGV